MALMIWPTTVMEEAGVVIDVFQARVDGAAVVVAENFDVIAVFAERRAEQIEVDGDICGARMVQCSRRICSVKTARSSGRDLPWGGCPAGRAGPWRR